LTAIYPYESPGGWHLIGMTPIRLFDVTRPRPALLNPGDIIQIEPIDPPSFASVKQAVDSGNYQVANEPIIQ